MTNAPGDDLNHVTAIAEVARAEARLAWQRYRVIYALLRHRNQQSSAYDDDRRFLDTVAVLGAELAAVLAIGINAGIRKVNLAIEAGERLPRRHDCSATDSSATGPSAPSFCNAPPSPTPTSSPPSTPRSPRRSANTAPSAAASPTTPRGASSPSTTPTGSATSAARTPPASPSATTSTSPRSPSPAVRKTSR